MIRDIHHVIGPLHIAEAGNPSTAVVSRIKSEKQNHLIVNENSASKEECIAWRFKCILFLLIQSDSGDA